MLRGKEGWKEFGVTPEMVEEKMGSCWSYTKVDFSLFDLIANSASTSMLLLQGIVLFFSIFFFAMLMLMSVMCLSITYSFQVFIQKVKKPQTNHK